MSAPHEKLLRKLFADRGMRMVLDIGACSGSEGVRYGRMFPGAKVHAFEPVPANYARVLETIRLNPDVPMEAHQMALSDREGSAELNLSNAEGDMAKHGNRSSSLLSPGKLIDVHPWLKFEERIVVPTRTLDAFCGKHGIASIDLIHMDVQGAELMVLKGGTRMLEHIRAVWLEVERIALYEDQPLKDDVEAFMRRHGFILAFSTVGRVAGDQLWLKRSFLHVQPLLVRISVAMHGGVWSVRSMFDRIKDWLRSR